MRKIPGRFQSRNLKKDIPGCFHFLIYLFFSNSGSECFTLCIGVPRWNSRTPDPRKPWDGSPVRRWMCWRTLLRWSPGNSGRGARARLCVVTHRVPAWWPPPCHPMISLPGSFHVSTVRPPASVTSEVTASLSCGGLSGSWPWALPPRILPTISSKSYNLSPAPQGSSPRSS